MAVIVNNESESEEVQKVFFEMGIPWRGKRGANLLPTAIGAITPYPHPLNINPGFFLSYWSNGAEGAEKAGYVCIPFSRFYIDMLSNVESDYENSRNCA